MGSNCTNQLPSDMPFSSINVSTYPSTTGASVAVPKSAHKWVCALKAPTSVLPTTGQSQSPGRPSGRGPRPRVDALRPDAGGRAFVPRRSRKRVQGRSCGRHVALGKGADVEPAVSHVRQRQPHAEGQICFVRLSPLSSCKGYLPQSLHTSRIRPSHSLTGIRSGAWSGRFRK